MDLSLLGGWYPWIKTLHVLSATILVGTGFGSAFFKFRVDRVGDLPSIVFASKTVVLLDWVLTTPAVLVQTITGFVLVAIAGYSLTQTWILLTLFLYVLTGCCWLPAVYLQIRMRDFAIAACESGGPLPAEYYRFARIWFWLGVFGFGAVLQIVACMVVKPAWFD
jgi:uncharacterized membrane protein